MNYIEIKFITQSQAQSEILIAMLAGIGFEGFEENENELKAFIKQIAFDKENANAISAANNISYSLSIIAQQNWNEEWEQSFEPVIVDDFVAIRASFHPPVKNVEHEIIITPKMSFGTGHHATTYLMISQMEKLNFTNKSVVDFGTGTGVLAILAQKMGASKITAIDNDEWSIDNAKENANNNNCPNIVIQMAEALETGNKYDIILANINLNIIVQNLPQIAVNCKPNATVVLSGFLINDKETIIKTLKYNKLIFSTFTQKNDWICVVATKN